MTTGEKEIPWRLLKFASRHRTKAVLATVYALLNKCFDLLPSVIIGAAIDVIVEREASFVARLGIADAATQLSLLVGLAAVTWCFESLFEYLCEKEWKELAQLIQHDLRVDVYAHLQRLDHSFFQQHATGDLVCRVNDDINQLEHFLNGAACMVIQTLFTVVCVGVSVFLTEPSLAWIPLLPIPFIIGGSLWFQSRLRVHHVAIRDTAGALGGGLSRQIEGVSAIWTASAEKQASARLEKLSRSYLDANRSEIRWDAAFHPLLRLTIVTGVGSIILFGGRQALAGDLNVGAYTVLIALTERILWPLSDIGWLFSSYRRAMASAKRTFLLLDQPSGPLSPLNAQQFVHSKGHLRMERVSLVHQGRKRPALEEVSLQIEPGKCIAIVGPTGAGKTTLLQLLVRLQEPQAGRLFFDEQALDELDAADLRRQVCLVTQETHLFFGSVHENIAWGDPSSTRAAVERAARQAGAHSFIEGMEQGYDTTLGEGGMTLSGGERQRLALARALLKEPSVLLLDEATSNIDRETEATIMESLRHARRGLTTVLVTHRLSKMDTLDKIFVMETGKVVAAGTHDELLLSSNLYLRLWAGQGEELLAAE